MIKPNYRFYRCCYRFLRASIGIFYRLEIIGKEYIPDNAAMVCSNHSSMVDPFLIAFAFGINTQVHVIAKAEIFKIPVISQALQLMGMISVDRGVLDAASVKRTLSYLKSGEKVVIFPEGTRVSEDDSIAAKTGAVKLVERTGVPVIPLFVPRKKPLFSKVPIVIGEPYFIEKQAEKRSASDYSLLSDVLMEKIKALNPDVKEQGA